MRRWRVPVVNLRTRRKIWIALVYGVTVALLSSLLTGCNEAAEEDVYILTEVIPPTPVTVWGAGHDVVKTDVTVLPGVQGGEVRMTLRYNDTCSEEYRFSWEFDRDISQLAPGDRFVVTAQNELAFGDCPGQEPTTMQIRGNNAGQGISPLIADRLTPEVRQSLFGKTETLKGDRGPTKASAELWLGEEAKGPFQWFEVDLGLGHGQGSVRHHVIYWYTLMSMTSER